MRQKAWERFIRRLPGIGWRADMLDRRAAQVERLRNKTQKLELSSRTLNEEVTELREELQQAQDELAAAGLSDMEPRASFRRNLLELRRNVPLLRALEPREHHPLLQIPRKLRNYRLGASHGIMTPRILDVWESIDRIDLSDLPGQFVLKSDGGAGGHGVFPLRGLTDGTFQIIGSQTTITLNDLRKHYREHRGSRPPYFAEEFLQQATVAEEIPDDIKLYAFYGEVGQVMLRRMPRHANLRAARYRYLSPTGEDLGEDISLEQRIDPTIAVPDSLSELVRIAEHLSRAVALPFIRVDLYETVHGPVLGELTRSPGGLQRHREDHDEHMGRMWDVAQYRLDLDVQRGRPLRILHGHHPSPNVYPDGHISHQADPKGWKVVTADCSTWCFGAAPVTGRG